MTAAVSINESSTSESHGGKVPAGRGGPEGTAGASPGIPGNAPANVRMTPAAIDTLRTLRAPEARSVARAIAAIGTAEGKPVPAASNGKRYLAMVPDSDKAPVVMYREADENGYLVTALVDRGTYQTYEIAERRGFLDSNAFKATVGAVAAAALGIILGTRAARSPHYGD